MILERGYREVEEKKVGHIRNYSFKSTAFCWILESKTYLASK
jgi:hypothetical protein